MPIPLTLANFPAGPSHYSIFKDFYTDEDLTEFVMTAIGGGSPTNAVLDTANYGIMRLSADAATTACGYEAQGDASTIALAAGKTIYFQAYVNLNETTSTNAALKSTVIAGLSVLDTSVIASAPTDYIYFQKVVDTAAWDCCIRAASGTEYKVASVLGVTTNTWYNLGIQVSISTSGVGNVLFYINSTLVANVTGQTLPLLSIFLTPTVCFKGGDTTGTKFLDVDYIGATVQR